MPLIQQAQTYWQDHIIHPPMMFHAQQPNLSLTLKQNNVWPVPVSILTSIKAQTHASHAQQEVCSTLVLANAKPQ